MKIQIYSFAFLLVFALFGAGQSFAQQTAFGTLYRNNMNLVNPAAIDRLLMSHRAFHPTLQFTANLRKQWALSDTEGTPTTGFIQFENAPDKKDKYDQFPIRWGAQVLFDKTDILTNYGFYGNYSYEFAYSGTRRKVRIGVTPGLVLRQYDVNRIRARDGIAQDPLLKGISDNPKRLLFDFGLGVFFHRSKDYNTRYWGFSLPNSFMLQFNAPNGEKALLEDRLRNFYFVWGRYISKWTYKDHARIDWEPTIWVRGLRKGSFQTLLPNTPLPLSVDVNLRMYLKSSSRYPPLFWLGAGYGTNKQLSIEGGYNIFNSKLHELEKNIQIGIAYNAPTSRSLLQLGHSFEVNLAWSWK